MRTLFTVATIGLGIALGLGACGDDAEEEPTPTDCGALLVEHACFSCVETACCGELAACVEDLQAGGCADCVAGDRTACQNPSWQALFQCGDAKCSAQCEQLQASDPTCDAPTTPPSDGSCAPPMLTSNFQCNPFTNEGCNEAAGEVCDYNAGQFTCFPGPNDNALCEPCGGEDGFCGSGLSCIQSVTIDPDGVNIRGGCARYCCDDGDCGSGTCGETVTVDGQTIGLCTGGDGGTGGGGG